MARVDIVDVVDHYVPLKKAGANYTACCPFHSEKSPSFTVSPSKQFYHCFGCGAHGSAIGFLMEYAGLSYPDAIRDLAQRMGLQVPEETGANRAPQQERTPLLDHMSRAAAFYREQLKSSPKAIDYLKRRGLTGEIAAHFGLGYAPEGWQALEAVFPDYGASALLELGLVIENEQGRRYDRFRDRIMFPILDQRGAVIGFGGRILDQGEPKYLNSPETPLFEKGRELYGLAQARQAIRNTDTVIVVEGYMDVVGLAQHGVENVVATLGTATTGTHIQKLLKQANRVVFCFDRDSAGDRAAWRAVEVSLEHLSDTKSVEILQMPGNQDPDEYIRENGRDAFTRHANQATKLSEFLVRGLVRKSSPSTAEGRARLLHEAEPLIKRITAERLQGQIAAALSKEMRLDAAQVAAQLGLRFRRQSAVRQGAARTAPSIYRTLLGLLLQKPDWAVRVPTELLAPDTLEADAIFALSDAAQVGDLPTGGIGALLEFFRSTPHAALFTEIATEAVGDAIDEQAMEDMFNDTIARLHKTSISLSIEALAAKDRSAGLSPEERRLLAQLLAQKQKLGSGQKVQPKDIISGFSDPSTTL